MPVAEARKVDLGYQPRRPRHHGRPRNRTPELVNNRQFYVSLSRPRTEARIYTDNVEGMRRAVSRKQKKGTGARCSSETASLTQPRT
jgi:hypothetical protein